LLGSETAIAFLPQTNAKGRSLYQYSIKGNSSAKLERIQDSIAMKIINIDQAQTQLHQLIESVRCGEDIVLSEAGNPVARLVVYQDTKQNRKPGLWEGQVTMAEDFNDDLLA
jgi:prevent-host-death family protein